MRRSSANVLANSLDHLNTRTQRGVLFIRFYVPTLAATQARESGKRPVSESERRVALCTHFKEFHLVKYPIM